MWYKQLLIALSILFYVECQTPPNIVIFVGDDEGHDDFSIFGSNQIPTPNLDALACNGVTFHKHYSMHICTPSRTALLTGNYPFRAGMEGTPIAAGEPRALPLAMKTMAELLRDRGYSTNLVGKWHLGYFNRSVTPNGRGFQSHLGYWNGFISYFTYVMRDQVLEGYDMHRNYVPYSECKNKYATDLFTDEANTIITNHNTSVPLLLVVSHLAAHTGLEGAVMETPTNDIELALKYSCIGDPNRRRYADVVNRMDASIGSVVKTLQQKGILDNTILVFISDNGAPTVGLFANSGCNWPFRGIKNTLWEGGVRNAGFAWSKLFKNKQYVDNNVFHIVDWLPTLYVASGGNVADLGPIDGISHWENLTTGAPLLRVNDVLLNVDNVNNFAAIMTPNGQFKLTQGTYQNGLYDYYFCNHDCITPYNVTAVLTSDVNIAIQSVDNSVPLTSDTVLRIRNELTIQQANAPRANLSCATNYCLFDLFNDPTETTDISATNPDIVQKLNQSLNAYRNEPNPRANTNVDPNSNPANCCFTWHPWLDPVDSCDCNMTAISNCVISLNVTTTTTASSSILNLFGK